MIFVYEEPVFRWTLLPKGKCVGYFSLKQNKNKDKISEIIYDHCLLQFYKKKVII